jgi:hypothetical protein
MRAVRLFLSSPGDVADERALARRLLGKIVARVAKQSSKVLRGQSSWSMRAAPFPIA